MRSPARMPSSPISCSRRSIRRCAASASPGARRWWWRTRSDSSASCRTSWWRRFARPSPKRARRRCCCTSSMPATRAATSRRARSSRCSTEIGAGAIPQILVYNKIDRLEMPARVDRDGDGRVTGVWISAEKRVRDSSSSRGALAERLARFARRARLKVPASAGALRSRLYAAQAVRAEKSADDGSIELSVELPDAELLQPRPHRGRADTGSAASGHALCRREPLPTIDGRRERDQAPLKRHIRHGLESTWRFEQSVGAPARPGRPRSRRAPEELAEASSKAGCARAAAAATAARCSGSRCC